MLPRWASTELLNDPGAEWYCLDCSGETPRERMEWAEDAIDETLENQDGDPDGGHHPDDFAGQPINGLVREFHPHG